MVEIVEYIGIRAMYDGINHKFNGDIKRLYPKIILQNTGVNKIQKNSRSCNWIILWILLVQCTGCDGNSWWHLPKLKTNVANQRGAPFKISD